MNIREQAQALKDSYVTEYNESHRTSKEDILMNLIIKAKKTLATKNG